MKFETRLTPAMAARWRGAGLWSNETLATVLARRVSETPDHEALTDSTHRLTYRELAHGIDRMAARLVSGTRRRSSPSTTGTAISQWIYRARSTQFAPLFLTCATRAVERSL